MGAGGGHRGVVAVLGGDARVEVSLSLGYVVGLGLGRSCGRDHSEFRKLPSKIRIQERLHSKVVDRGSEIALAWLET